MEGGESALVTVVIKLERISYFIRSFTAICNAIINRTGTGFLDARASHHGYKLEQVYIGYQYSHLIDNAPSTIACTYIFSVQPSLYLCETETLPTDSILLLLYCKAANLAHL